MKRKITVLIAIAAPLAAVLIAAGCGSSASGSAYSVGPYGSAAVASASVRSSTGTTKVGVASSRLGRIVVDGKGRTLYLFAKDTGMKSNCSGACTSNWPPFTATSKPAASGGVSASAISLVKRSDGAKQVTLDGHPLYYFSGDQSAGQMNGQGVNEFGAKWWAVAPSGTQVTGSAKSSGGSSSGSSSGSGGGGYSY
jgi:predicted lipoprotein with Yx(FWY)xxD motif